jgi:hypothetical protein
VTVYMNIIHQLIFYSWKYMYRIGRNRQLRVHLYKALSRAYTHSHAQTVKNTSFMYMKILDPYEVNSTMEIHRYTCTCYTINQNNQNIHNSLRR